MTPVEVLGTVGTLQLDQKLNVPPGRERTRRAMAAARSPFRTDGEATAWIEELRDDGDRIEEAYRQAEEAKRRDTAT